MKKTKKFLILFAVLVILIASVSPAFASAEGLAVYHERILILQKQIPKI